MVTPADLSHPVRVHGVLIALFPMTWTTLRQPSPWDFNGSSLVEVEDKIRFQKARPGDHLCTAFQCPNFQSQNIWRRNTERGNAENEVVEAICTHVILDAFWSHSSNTVAGHVREVKFVLKYANMLGI